MNESSHHAILEHLEQSQGKQRFAIRLSLIVGFVMLAGKSYAYFITGSAAILSDAAESVVHVVAVSFAAFSLWLSMRPADESHPYGHEKISFFSAGTEGAMIVLAAVYIIYAAINKWLHGLQIENLGEGTLFTAAATLINAILGGYLVWQGKKHGSLILVANGKHVLTDSWTSLGVIVGLVLVIITGWLPFDPILAILVALNILWSGGKLIRQSVGGLMDERDPKLEQYLRRALNEETSRRGLDYHQFRSRNTGTSVWVDLHLLFPKDTTIESAHWQATEIEGAIKAKMGVPIIFTTHLEPVEQHDETHQTLKAEKD
ncbi:MAG TPA: cation diffusion facilitator family transporter [Bacteroidota bacterium]